MLEIFVEEETVVINLRDSILKLLKNLDLRLANSLLDEVVVIGVTLDDSSVDSQSFKDPPTSLNSFLFPDSIRTKQLKRDFLVSYGI